MLEEMAANINKQFNNLLNYLKIISLLLLYYYGIMNNKFFAAGN